jgi:shikimate dehydrogenase
VSAGITGATRVYLHLAHPSAHARTPQVMNAEFARRGIDAVAVSADVAPGDLGAFMGGLRGWRNLAGLSVTMPHKEALTAHVDELAGAAALVGAVNVVRRESDGRLTGANTDGAGFVIGLHKAGHRLSGRRVLLAGAGGAGRAVAFAVAGAGAAGLTVANRTAVRAERLASDVAADFPVMAVAAGPPDPAGHDVVINATSLGMQPGDPLPVLVGRLAPGTLVCDIVTRPARTQLLREAAARGCVPHPGLPMLAGQVDLILDFLGLTGHRPGWRDRVRRAPMRPSFTSLPCRASHVTALAKKVLHLAWLIGVMRLIRGIPVHRINREARINHANRIGSLRCPERLAWGI